MKTRLVQLKIFSILMLILIGYNQCGNPYNLETTELEYTEAPLAGSLSSSESVDTFRTSVYSLTSQYCVGCHTTQQPQHAHPDVKTAHDALIALYKVNFQNPANSRIVAKLRDDNHGCWGNCADNSNEMLAMVEIWADKVNELEEEQEETTGGNGSGGSTNGSTTGGSMALDSVGAFEQTVYQLTTENCIQCHANTAPQHANQNIQLAHDSLLNQGKINFNNIPASRMVQRLRVDQHNCWGNCEANAVQMENAIAQWKSLTEDQTGYVAEGVVSAQSDFIANVLASNSASDAFAINLAGGNIQAPFVYDNGNQYLYAPPGSGNNFDANANVGMATYNININKSATYKLRANVSASSNNDNSFFFRVDNGNYFDWHAIVNGGFSDQIVTRGSGMQDISFTLNAGNHTVVVKQREDNTKLKELSFVEFNGNTVLPPGTVYLEYELKDLLGVQDSVVFRIKIREFDEYSYQVYGPEIISNYNIRVQNIKLLLNNYYNPQHSTFTFVDAMTTPQNTSVSNYAMIVLKDQGPALDKISFEFGTLQIMN
tara:strand:+ start:255736 stop:257364 length:1629 start_codon:yes stop_codon:yes gene_type:complete